MQAMAFIKEYILNIVLLLPPAPAALVLLGLAFATLSFWSAAARLRIAVFGPPGGVGEEVLPAPGVTAGEFTGEEARGEDYGRIISIFFLMEEASLPCAVLSYAAKLW